MSELGLKWGAGALALGAFAMSASAAWSATPAPTGSDAAPIVITATPLDTDGAPLSSVPANAQRLQAGDISRQNPSNLADLLNSNIGSVSVSDGSGNPYQNDVNYRGFQATSLLGAPVGLAVYFDGVRANEPFGSIVNWDLIPMNAVASVDLLPGSNPIFGLNALGGALVVNTKTGADNPGVSASVLGGSFGRWAAGFEAGGADAASGLDGFLAGDYDRQTGFRDYSASEVKQLFGKARWRAPQDRVVVELSATLADSVLNGTQSLPMDMLSTPSAAYTWPDSISNQMRLVKAKADYRWNPANQLSVQAYYRQSNSQSLNSNAELDVGCFNDDGTLVAACANQAPGGTAINAVTGANALALGYGRWTGDINTSLVVSTTRQQTLGGSAQWRNTSPLAGRANTFTLGGGFDQSNIAYGQATYLARLIGYQTVVIPNQEYGFTANGLAPSAANPPSFSGSNVLSSVALGSRVGELDLYVTDTLRLTDRLSVTAAGSFEYTSLVQSGLNSQFLNDDGGYSWTDDVTGLAYYNPGYVSAYKYANSGTGAATSANGARAGSIAGPQTESLNGVHSYQRFNPSIGLNYNLAPAIGLFADYSESMRAPTSIELSCANPDSPCALPTGFNGDPALKSVTAATVEFGGRGQLGSALAWNAAIYDSRLQNDIQFISTSTTYGYFFNVGATERLGLELGARAALGKLTVSADYGYVDAAYRSAFTTQAGEDVRSGDHIPGIPASTFKLRADYAFNDRLQANASLIAVGPQYAHGNENNADPNGLVPGYAMVDVGARYRVTGALSLALDIDNLLDQKYATYGLSGSTSIYSLATEQFRTPAPPRGIWLKVTYALGRPGRSAAGD